MNNSVWECALCGTEKHATLEGTRACGWFVDEVTYCASCAVLAQSALEKVAAGEMPFREGVEAQRRLKARSCESIDGETCS